MLLSAVLQPRPLSVCVGPMFTHAAMCTMMGLRLSRAVTDFCCSAFFTAAEVSVCVQRQWAHTADKCTHSFTSWNVASFEARLCCHCFLLLSAASQPLSVCVQTVGTLVVLCTHPFVHPGMLMMLFRQWAHLLFRASCCFVHAPGWFHIDDARCSCCARIPDSFTFNLMLAAVDAHASWMVPHWCSLLLPLLLQLSATLQPLAASCLHGDNGHSCWHCAASTILCSKNVS